MVCHLRLYVRKEGQGKRKNDDIYLFIFDCVRTNIKMALRSLCWFLPHYRRMATAEGQTKQQPLRILAIGDSLTEGYHKSGYEFHPYAKHLTDLLDSAKISVQIKEKGISGERVVPQMLKRFRRILETEESYDWVIILGGTNDVGNRIPAERIFKEGLQPMYEACLNRTDRKMKLAAMTVIQNAFNAPTSKDDENRQLLNTMIRDYVAQSKDQDRIVLVDLDKGIPYHSLRDATEKKQFWDDGLHLTPAGYDLMAKLIFDVIKSKL